MKKETLPHILAIDHGTSGVKTALVSILGRIADFESAPTPIRFFPGGGAEQDPGDWWRALVRASRKMLSRKSVPARNIAAVAVSSTLSSTVAVDERGSPLYPCITWMDSCGAPYVKKIMGGFPELEGYNIPRIVEWIKKTGGGPQLSGKDDIAHVLLLKEEQPAVYDKTYKFLGSKDYLNLALTGEFAASHDSIMLFWITDTRNPSSIRYDESLIKRLGIDAGKLPRLVQPTEIIGSLRPQAAAALGLHAGIKVACGSPDHQSALVGSGAVRDFEGHLYIGTSSWIECIVPFKKTDLFHSIASVPSAIPGRYQCINEQDLAGGCLSFLLKNIMYHGEHARPVPRDPYRALDEIAGRVPPGANGLIFAPWLNGERSPVDSTTLRGGFHNLSVRNNADDMARAVFEGVALNTRWSLKYVERFTGKSFPSLNFIGGGAKSKIWCRILADVTGRTIRQVRDPIMANARGAAFIASVGLGQIAFDDIPGLVEIDQSYQPDEKNRGVYDTLFDALLKIYRNNRSMYEKLNRSPV